MRGGRSAPATSIACSRPRASHDLRRGRAVLHALPTGFSLDEQHHIVDPAGMIGEQLGVDLHVVTSEAAAARNLMLAVERCHLGVEAVIATPYAAGLSALVDDEAEMGCAVVDMGGGTTSVGVFANGHLVHADAIAVGGHHVTMDIARGLTTRVSAAERLKTLYGSAIASSSDERDMIAVPQVDEDERDVPNHLPKSHLVRIIKPRVEEILELVRDRLQGAGFAAQAGRRVVLTGGASQLVGLPETARRILQGQVRVGRPLGIKGLPEAAKGPAFSAVGRPAGLSAGRAYRAFRAAVAAAFFAGYGNRRLLLASGPVDPREFLMRNAVARRPPDRVQVTKGQRRPDARR